jgi:hypothetical protein
MPVMPKDPVPHTRTVHIDPGKHDMQTQAVILLDLEGRDSFPHRSSVLLIVSFAV